MVERMTCMPAGTIGFRVTDDLEPEDYERVLVPDLRAAVESGDGIRVVFVLEDLDEIEPGALWQDTKLGVDAVRHHHAWERSAIVTDIDWMVRAARLFTWMIPGQARVFELGQLEDAKAWVAS